MSSVPFPAVRLLTKVIKGTLCGRVCALASIDPMVAAAALAPTHTIKKTDNLCIWID